MIRIGPAGAPRWFDQRLDRLGDYLDHIVAHGAGCIEFVVHGGEPGDEAERVHLPRRNWLPAINAAQARGLEVHLHAPLASEYRLNGWATDRSGLTDRYLPIVDLLGQVQRSQDRPPVLVLHAASTPNGNPTVGEEATREFIVWLLDSLEHRQCAARIAVELRLRAEESDLRFDRRMSSLGNFVAGFGTRQVGICLDIANYLGSAGIRDEIQSSMIAHISHVHLHDSHPEGRGLHAPLGTGRLDWHPIIERLLMADWRGAITLEIRYRYALEQGEPWHGLAESLARVNRVLNKE